MRQLPNWTMADVGAIFKWSLFSSAVLLGSCCTNPFSRPEHNPADSAPTRAQVQAWRVYCAGNDRTSVSCNACASESGCGWCGATRSCMYTEDMKATCSSSGASFPPPCNNLPEEQQFAPGQLPAS